MVRRLIFGVLVAAVAFPLSAWAAVRPDAKLDRELQARARAPRGHSRVIVRLNPGVGVDAVDKIIKGVRGTAGRRLPSLGAQVVDVPDGALDTLARLPGVTNVSLDRRIRGTLERTGGTVGATFVRDSLGFDGTGVGVAVIDSGVASWHDDLGSSRVTRFVDFVNYQAGAYDDYGHGTHVAGIIAGNGYDSGGKRRGIAPGATLLVEKVLDGSGQGYISNVIAAIDYAIANKDTLNLRVINLSVAAGVYESYTTDPLTLAAKRAVDAGLVVVSAAGNLGRGADGRPQWGAIGAPGNAPWVITVGASSHNGTVDRSDDTIAPFSSRGPSAIDFQAKPDLVAPGVGIESLAEAGSTLYNTKPLMRLWGEVQTATEPYLSLSGTSMAAPVVSGTIALMLQANPTLTPNQVKAILQFTAESRDGYNDLTQGAGFLNARGAVEMAKAAVAGAASETPADAVAWSRHIIWGNHRLGESAIADLQRAGAWAASVTWGAGAVLGAVANPADDRNVVWGADCGGADCTNVIWGASSEGDNIVWGTANEGDNIVWGTSSDEGDNIVWGTNAAEAADDVIWSAPAIRRPSRVLATDDEAHS